MTTQRAALTSHDRAAGAAAPRDGASWTRPIRRAQGFLGRHLSIRWKLTVWYALIYLISLAVVAFALPFVFEIRNNQAIDRSLHDTAQSVLNSHQVKDLIGPPADRYPGIPRLCKDSALVLQQYCNQIQYGLTVNALRSPNPGQYEQAELFGYGPRGLKSPLVTPRFGRVVKLSAGLSPTVLTQAILAPTYANVNEGGTQYRVYLVKINTPLAVARLGGGGILEVLQKQTTYSEVQRELFTIILVTIPFMTIFGLVVGWFVARAALRPIGRISRTVQSVGGSRDLSRRLDFVGPMDEVGRLAETFDSMMDRLEQSFETQKRFIADASHELRTPLTAIKGNAELISIAPADERDLCVSAIRREAERMSRLVNDLLLLAEADIAEQPIHPRPLDLQPLVEDVFRAAQLLGGDKVTVLLEEAQPTPAVADPDRIKQLLLNLVDNAVKFTPEGGTVSLRLSQNGGWTEIAVSDTGVGISSEEQDAIFRRFYRVDKSRSTRGSGLGLAICSWIAEAHGGSIEVSSNPGKGSTFALRFPATPSSQDPTTQPSTKRITRG